MRHGNDVDELAPNAEDDEEGKPLQQDPACPLKIGQSALRVLGDQGYRSIDLAGEGDGSAGAASCIPCRRRLRFGDDLGM